MSPAAQARQKRTIAPGSRLLDHADRAVAPQAEDLEVQAVVPGEDLRSQRATACSICARFPLASFRATMLARPRARPRLGQDVHGRAAGHVVQHDRDVHRPGAAEALRSWDGAHTGPRGERHGLKYLLDAAEQYQTPITLLDLKDPENLSALDAMGALEQVRRMQEMDLLILPQTSSDEILFGLPVSLYLFSPEAPRRSISKDRFQFIADVFHLHRWLGFPQGTFTIIPVATQSDSTQPTPDGPTLEVRRALLETALNEDEKDLLVLGGSLRGSTWGSREMVGPTLEYFASRPYIHLLSSAGLVDFPAKWGQAELLPFPRDEALARLEAHYKALTRPVLEFAASWRGSPLSSCETDIDQDGRPECVLANGQYLAVLDPRGARLTYLFAVERVGNPPHQLIGPSWQVAVGLSNPSLWDLSAGEAADPGAYPGAFVDSDDPFSSLPTCHRNRHRGLYRPGWHADQNLPSPRNRPGSDLPDAGTGQYANPAAGGAGRPV